MSYSDLYPIAFLDSPRVLNCTVTPIPGGGSAPLQVVADIGFRAPYALDFIDSTGDFIGVYVGSIGQERLLTIIGGGSTAYRSYGVIHARARVSFRSMTATPITNGYISVVFMGVGAAI